LASPRSFGKSFGKSHGCFFGKSFGPPYPVDTFELRLAIARFHAGNLSAQEAGVRVGVTGQTLLGHSSPETTRRYVHVPDESLRAAVMAARA
jgi:integrase